MGVDGGVVALDPYPHSVGVTGPGLDELTGSREDNSTVEGPALSGPPDDDGWEPPLYPLRGDVDEYSGHDPTR